MSDWPADMPKPDWRSNDGSVLLYCGDCLEILPTLPDGCVDAVVADPPYGVMLGEVSNGQCREKQQQPYSQFQDSAEYVKSVCVPAIVECVRRFSRVVLTPGTRNLRVYPPWDAIGSWFNPAGTGLGKWGFICSHPILYYGKDPRRGVAPSPDSCTGNFDRSRVVSEHPCPKPVSFMRWLVAKASLDDETILDPFMGSGTTGVACVKLGRKFIGIELEQKYLDISVKRIQQAFDDQGLFRQDETISPDPAIWSDDE